MNDISQTKEGFIKSMILFIVLLGVCFAPFFALGQENTSATVSQINSSDRHVVATPSEEEVALQVSSLGANVWVDFVTGFSCYTYELEAKTDSETEFTSISYCKSEQCEDAINSVSYLVNNQLSSYTSFRVKAVNNQGDIVYSDVQTIQLETEKDIEILSSSVSDVIPVKINTISEYTYSISSLNGQEIQNDMPLTGESIALEQMETGFYVISFRRMDGVESQFKFFKNLTF